MKKNTKELMREIKSGKNLEINLPQYANNLITSYYKFSMIRLTMQYYTYYQVISEENSKQDTIMNREINEIIISLLKPDFKPSEVESMVQRLECIRDDVIKKMKVLTAYTDILQIYEHILNRLEYKFTNNTEVVNDTEFANEVVQYIFDTKDNIIINNKIKEIIGQLPVRMTKSKYFELISDSLSVYKGAEMSSVDNYLYMLRTSSMLYKPEGMDEYFTDLGDLILELSQVSYKDIEESNYNILVNRVKEAARDIEESVDYYVSIQEIVNNLYTIVLAVPYVMVDNDEDENICKEIINDINQSFIEEEFKEIAQTTTQKLTLIEGSQEDLFYEYSTMESLLYEVRTTHSDVIEGLMLDKIFNCLNIASMLLSSSIFIELNESFTTSFADETYIKEVTKQLLEDFTEIFSKNEQVVNRAIMANTLNKMPVFFNTTDEVISYINGSLNQCRDHSEKCASIQIIRMMMDIV